MKTLKALAILILVTASAVAQEASINAPVVRPSEAKIRLWKTEIDFAANQVVISLSIETSGNERVRYLNVVVPSAAQASTFNGILSAMGTARPTETGGAERRANFRILGYLVDRGYPELSGVTLLP